MIRFRFILLLLTSFCFVSLSSCHRSGGWRATDPNFVAAAVGRLADALNNEEKLNQLYSEGAFPDKGRLSNLRRYMPKTRAENVRVDGDTATADVMFEITSTGEQLGPQKWTFVRVGEVWKLQDTPPP